MIGELGTVSTSRGIAGGFVRISSAALLATWRACRVLPLGIGDFRAWLAAHELTARRCLTGSDQASCYSSGELARLLGVSEKRAKGSVHRLVDAGLLEWSDSAIGFPDPRIEPGDLEETIGRGRGSVVVPRRLLRFLAQGARPALIATALALLLRCLSRRKAGFDGRGRVKASWIARVFAISTRQAQGARKELVDLGWIVPEEASQWSMNRYGRVFRINLDWVAPRPRTGSISTYPRPDPGSISTYPCLDQEPSLSGGQKNQEPGPTGVWLEESGSESPTAPEVVSPLISAPTTTTPALPPPRFEDVRPEDLKDTGRLLDLHRQGVAQGRVGASEGDRLKFVAAAEHALAIGKGNPPGLFAYLVRNGCWRYLTVADEDRANARIKAFQRGPEPSREDPGSRPFSIGSRGTDRTPPGLSEDARIVKAVRDAAIRAGIFRDPYPAFQARYPEWGPDRWASAMKELGLG